MLYIKMQFMGVKNPPQIIEENKKNNAKIKT